MLKTIDEVLDLFAFLYTENDKSKAKNILDRKREVSDSQLVKVSMFTGAALAQLLMLIATTFLTRGNLSLV